ncbi:DUF481 domain-containing protein [Kordia sp. TARA_039_SRF]|jgi:hypothetical protein|nr:DUF481 domain-containing protein [Kordia sp. TARA_039_SRF]
MKKIWYCLCLFPIFLTAQINESDSLKVKADLSLTGFWQGGNVDTFIFRAKSEVAFKPFNKWVFKTKNSYVYQEFGKEKADEDILSLNFLYLNPKKRFYPQALAFISTNFRREIDLRYLVGGGVTYQILTHKKRWLKVSLTSEYEYTRFSMTDFNKDKFDGSGTINTLRGTIWINGKYHLFKDKVILSHESFFQPSIRYNNNFRWQADVGIELPIWKFLNFKVNYLHTFESVVVADQKQEDQFLTFGLTLKSY